MSMYPRSCWACRKTELQPTDRLEQGLRVYECTHCQATILWTDNPVVDGSYAEMHQIVPNQYSTRSMLNDPNCTVFHKQKLKRTVWPGHEWFLHAESSSCFVEKEDFLCGENISADAALCCSLGVATLGTRTECLRMLVNELNWNLQEARQLRITIGFPEPYPQQKQEQ